MPIKIGIFGSTGSIGSNTVEIIKKNKKDFKVMFLTTNNNVNKIYKQAILLKVKNLIIINKNKYLKNKKKFINKKIKVFHNYNEIKKIIKGKLDYSMCSISGLAGLHPTIKAIRSSKTVGIANKESIICAWNIIKNELKKNKTKFIPIDSEHFSIWSLIDNKNKEKIDEITLTASGGPFLHKNINQIKNVNPNEAIKHPNWKMGKKISIDSATLMNKVFELIEAKNIFELDISKFKILIHPNSYIHAIVKFNNGIVKFLAHDTDMKIPIFNSIYLNKNKKISSNKLNLKYLNNLNLSKPDKKKFLSLNIVKLIPRKNSFFETALIAANDELVRLYLNKKIRFNDINKYLMKILKFNKYKKLFFKLPKDINEILLFAKEVRLKTYRQCIKYQ